MTFDRDQFVEDCIAAVAEARPEPAIRELVTAAVQDPSAVLRALGEPVRAGVQRIHVTDSLTIINVIWAPRMTLMPPQPRNVGCNRGLWWPRGQYLLAPPGR